MPNEIAFSVIIPVFHNGDLLRRSIEAVAALDYPPAQFEAIVCGRTNDPEARGIVERAVGSFPTSLRYADTNLVTRSAALNAGIAASRGRWLAFVDDDVFVERDWLVRLEEALTQHPQAAMIGGVDRLVDDAGLFDLAFDAVLHSFLGGGGIRRGTGVRAGRYYPRLWNMVMPREVAMAVATKGPDGQMEVFKNSLAVHEDVELGERVYGLGQEVLFAPNAKVLHQRDTNFTLMVKRDFQNGRASRSEGLHRRPHAILSTCLLGAIALAIGGFFWWPLHVALAVAVGAYAVLLVGVAISAAFQKRRLGPALLAPVIAASLHLARATGFLVGGKPT